MSGAEEEAPPQGPPPPAPPKPRTNVPLPRPLELKGNQKDNWRRFKQVWDSYEIVTGLDQQTDRVRIAHFIMAIGPEALDIHNGLPFKPGEEKQFNKVLEYWEQNRVGKANVTYKRYQFNNCSQMKDESFDAYYVHLRKLVGSCAYSTKCTNCDTFHDFTDEFLKDRIVCGLYNDVVREQLLSVHDLTLDKCLDTCRASESSKKQSKEISQDQEAHVNYLNKGKKHRKSKKFGKPKSEKAKQSTEIDCKFCGSKHVKAKSQCPAWGQKCKACKKRNHFAKKCPNTTEQAHAVVSDSEPIESDDSSDSSFYVEVVEGHEVLHVANGNDFPDRVYTVLQVQGQKCTMQIDTDSTCNVLPMHCLEMLHKGTEIKPTSSKLKMYNKDNLKVVGTVTLKITNPKNGKQYNTDFMVVNLKGTMQKPLIGARTAQHMEIIEVKSENISPPTNSVHEVTSTGEQQAYEMTHTGDKLSDISTEFNDVFEGIGHMPGKIHLQVDKEAKPVVMPPRRVPIAVKPLLKKELDRLEGLNVIEKVREPSDWVSGLTSVVKPNGKLRMCLDPPHLNSALKREHYPLPVIEDVLPELNNVKVFSKADCKEGFFQCELDDESAALTCFQTPWGRYRYRRLAFGLAPSPELFQARLDQCLEGLEGIHTIADDILITGRGDTLEQATRDHDKNMRNFLNRCRENKIKLNKSKFAYKMREVQYIGHLLTSSGLKADPNKVAAVLDMDPPTDVAGVQRFVGMVKYLSKFLPDLSDVSEPIRRLTHTDVEWQWTSEQDQAFRKIKQLATSAPVLKYFDSTIDTEGQGDASDHGLGFALLQNDQPVTYASRALTSAETRYSQIEKELLAQVFGLQRNHQYVYGRKVRLWTDHKPLIAIAKKPLSACPKRLQRLLQQLRQYDVELCYKPGKEMYIADTLSRAYLPNTARSTAEKETETIHMIDDLPISAQSHELIVKTMAEDQSLQVVKQYVLHGWPDNKSQVKPEAHPYFNVRDELTVENDILFRGTRVVVPQKARSRIRQKLHNAHPGVQATLRKARDYVYWPNMTTELKDYVSQCESCNSYQPAQSREPLICHTIPSNPWEKVGVDILTLDSKDYLCTVDYYSDFFELDTLPHSKNASAIIKRLKRHFATHGIPSILQSDNGPPFNSNEFRQFADEYSFTHTTSSPEYPQSNGKVESAVKIAKTILRKATDLDLALLSWRNTPTEGMDSSPAQRLFSRRTRTQIPTKQTLLKPEVQPDVKSKKERKQAKQKKQFDKGAKELPELQVGEIVRVKLRINTDKRWVKAKVLQKVNIRSYVVMTTDGQKYRRNRKHLRSSQEDFAISEKKAHAMPVHIQSSANKRDAKQNHQQDSHKEQHKQTRKSTGHRQTDKHQSAHKGNRKKTDKQVCDKTAQQKDCDKQINLRCSTRKKTKPGYLKDYVT